MKPWEIIKEQIGGKALYLIGAKNLSYEGDNIFSFRCSSRIANHVKIEYVPGSDLYKMTFTKIHGLKVTIKAEHTGIYADMLHKLIEKETGLVTSL